MAKDKNKLINYDLIVDNALRSVVKTVLHFLEKKEEIGDHHFFITFSTKHQSVNIPNSFMENHPNTMTIVLQHQFWDLKVEENRFLVTLSFNGKQEKLSIGYDSITQFTDPSTDFSLQFSSGEQVVNDDNLKNQKTIYSENFNQGNKLEDNKDELSKTLSDTEKQKSGEVVSFDKFKKK